MTAQPQHAAPTAALQQSITAAAPALPELADFSDFAFLTVAEVAAVMRISKMTVYRMIHTGELPSKRVGRSFRVLATGVRTYLTTPTPVPVPAAAGTAPQDQAKEG